MAISTVVWQGRKAGMSTFHGFQPESTSLSTGGKVTLSIEGAHRSHIVSELLLVAA